MTQIRRTFLTTVFLFLDVPLDLALALILCCVDVLVTALFWGIYGE